MNHIFLFPFFLVETRLRRLYPISHSVAHPVLLRTLCRRRRGLARINGRRCLVRVRKGHKLKRSNGRTHGNNVRESRTRVRTSRGVPRTRETTTTTDRQRSRSEKRGRDRSAAHGRETTCVPSACKNRRPRPNRLLSVFFRRAPPTPLARSTDRARIENDHDPRTSTRQVLVTRRNSNSYDCTSVPTLESLRGLNRCVRGAGSGVRR